MKNKSYYYKKDVVKRSKMYGTTTYKLIVYGIKSGKLYRVGETEYNSGSTCGEWGEVWHLLRSAGLVPKTSDVWDGSKICAYTWAREVSDRENSSVVTLIEVFNLDKEAQARLYSAARAVNRWRNATNWARLIPDAMQEQIRRYIFGEPAAPNFTCERCGCWQA